MEVTNCVNNMISDDHHLPTVMLVNGDLASSNGGLNDVGANDVASDITNHHRQQKGGGRGLPQCGRSKDPSGQFRVTSFKHLYFYQF